MYGQVVTFSATVAAASPGAGTATGTVTFTEGSTTLVSGVALNSSAQATFTVASLAVGNNTITASYSGDGNFLTSSGSDSAAPQVVNQASSTTTVSSTANPSVWGQAVTFTATVAAVSPGAGTATGTVTFTEGSTTLVSGVALNGSEQGTFTISSLAVGNNTITASYSGDGNFLTSTGSDSSAPQVVNKASSTTTVSSTANPSVWGQAVTFTATIAAVSPGVGTATGTVTFMEGSTTLASGVGLNGSAQATFTISSLAVGSNTVTANYSGDGNFSSNSASDSGSPQIVNKASSTTTVSSAANPSVWGQAVTFTATIAAVGPGAGTATGTATFTQGSTTLVSGVALNSSGQATFTISSLAVGNNKITVSYSGNGNFLTSSGSDSAAPQVVNQASSTTTVSSAANPSVWGQGVTFTATVAAVSPGVGTATGTVTFTEGNATLASGVGLNSSAQATFTISSLAVGNNTITANYSGDGNFSSSTASDSGSPQVVNKTSSTTTVTSAANPSVWGQVVTFTAMVAAAGLPTGTVTFMEGSTTLASGVGLNGSAQATFTISALAVGSNTITASYSGDGNFLTSTGGDSSSPQVVNQASSTTTLTSAANPAVWGQAVTFTATVAAVSPVPGPPPGP